MYPAEYAPYVPCRGFLFWCVGPVTNSQYPLIFENLTFDGGVTSGLQDYTYWILRQGNGEGWDITHGAVMDYATGDVQMHQSKSFVNCVFQHWRGEILKSTVGRGGTNTFIWATNCTFYDGNASAWNFTFAHHIEHCGFSNLVKVLEFYEDYGQSPSVLENCVWTNCGNAFTIVGATTNHSPPLYTIQNNIMDGSGVHITFSPAQNVVVRSNTFH